VILSFASASGQDHRPNITGLWRSVEFAGITHQGTILGSDTVDELEITTQNGPIFFGTYRWTLAEPIDQLDDGTGIVNMAEEVIFGVIASDGVSLTIGEHPDTTYRYGRLLDTDRLELTVIESGPHGVAAWMIMERQ
jgi:hypothetical protein